MNLTNHFIIAMPGLADPMFAKTVSYICQHNEHGAMGITINRPTNITFKELLSQLDIILLDEKQAGIPVYLGGPVETGHGFVLHNNFTSDKGENQKKFLDIDWAQTLKINEHISLSSSVDILKAIAQGEGPEKFLVALGCSGWGGGQIEHEMLDNSWLTVPADNNIIFNIESHLRWETAAMKLGIDINLMSSQSGHA